MATGSHRLGFRGRSLTERLLGRRRAHGSESRLHGLLAACLGPLEIRVLEALWRIRGEAGVRAIMADFPGCAYTTLMTTLDRLYKKDLLVRRKVGRAYVYAPRYEPAELEVTLARDAIDDLLRTGPTAGVPEPLLVGFVEAVGQRDARMLEELERLVRRHRRAARLPEHRGEVE